MIASTNMTVIDATKGTDSSGVIQAFPQPTNKVIFSKTGNKTAG